MGVGFGHPGLFRLFSIIELVIKAVTVNITEEQRWVLLYVKRWLTAPLQHSDGTMQQRERGTPQGSAVSPVLANLVLHYAFDMSSLGSSRAWHSNVMPTMRWCTARPNDSQQVWAALRDRLGGLGLELHPDKTSDRVLQGRSATWRLPARVVHVPWLHVPAPRCQDSVRADVRRFPSGGQRCCADRDGSWPGPPMAVASVDDPEPG